MNKDRILKVLNLLIDDCEKDVDDFDGREFDGKTLGELHGVIEAKIQAHAKIIKEMLTKG